MTRQAFAFACLLIAYGCATWQHDVKTVLDVTQEACVLAHGSFSDVPEIQTACGIADALIPELERLLEAKRLARLQSIAAGKECRP